ncbi:DNA cytosine methyltransferase [Brasilonema sp. CT11]|nr:DNA cytosine methyltransferase [Brasilonema sp. CT11]
MAVMGAIASRIAVGRGYTLNQIDLCSGIGAGFPLAGSRLGTNLIGYGEIDEFCLGILSKRFPTARNLGDVKKTSAILEELDRTDFCQRNEPLLVTASPPCQPFSLRGKRLGSEDERDCIPSILEFIRRIQPDYFLMENVPGLLTCRYKQSTNVYYTEFIGWALDKIGYNLQAIQVGSGSFPCAFKRERVLLVAVANSIKFYQQPPAWIEQVRTVFETAEMANQPRGDRSNVLRARICNSNQLEQPRKQLAGLGVPTRIPGIRQRRQALGNCLDPRIAEIGINRVLLFESLRTV